MHQEGRTRTMTRTMTINGVTYEYHHTAMARGYLCKSQDGLTEDYKGRYGEGKKIHRHTTETTYYHPVEYWIEFCNYKQTYKLCNLCVDAECILKPYIENADLYDIFVDICFFVDENWEAKLTQEEIISKYEEVKKMLVNAQEIADEIDNSKLWIELDSLLGRCIIEQPLSEHF